ncbi:MAG: hypothetical protein ACI4PQ_08580 [Butyricicoccaceae bacterium]
MIFAMICVIVICLALAFFERFLANMKGRVPGLVLPCFFAFISVYSLLSTVWQILPNLTQYGTPLQIVVMLVLMFVVLNVPTLITYVVFVLCRRKKGETPWPLRRGTDAPSGTDPDGK